MMSEALIHRSITSRGDWDESAQEYSAFASRQAIYLESAEAIARLAGIDRGMVVLDLACGSGVVTESILRQPHGSDVEIIAVDYSSEMLERARQRIDSPNVRFFQCRAEELSEVITKKVDRILCNAAFWHFDKARAFSEIARVLRPSGKALIGLPIQNFKVIDVDRAYPENKVIWMIMEEKELRGHLTTRPSNDESSRQRKTALAKDKNEILGYMSGKGLSLERTETITINSSPKDYIDSLRIPVMTANSFLFKGITYEETLEILDVVDSELEWIEASRPPTIWQILIVERKGQD